MAARNRPVPTIFGEDPEYSKVLSSGSETPVSTSPPKSPKQEKPGSVRPPKPKSERGSEGMPADPKTQPPAGEMLLADDPKVIVVRPAVKPLDRQWAELDELAASNYQIPMILRLALQHTTKNAVIEASNEAVIDDEAGTGRAVRAYVSVPRHVIAELSEIAGDLGTMSAAQLARPQVQRAFVAELDKVIEKLKGKLR